MTDRSPEERESGPREPGAPAYDPFSPEILEDPLPVYARLRAESPVHYLERHDAWALSRFEDVWNAGEDPATFVTPGPVLQTAEVRKSAEVSPEQLERVTTGANLFNMNPPEHTELRRRVARHFSPRAVRRLEPRLRGRVRDCLAKALPRGRCDVIADLAGRISVEAACLLIGLPTEDGDRLAAIVHRFFAREPGFEGMTLDALRAAEELHVYLRDAVARRRRRPEPGDDVLARYLDARVGGRRFADEEIAQHLQLLVVGGTETLPKVFAGGVVQLHRHPDQRAELAAHPERIPDAFTEIARYEMPTQFLTRTVARDVTLRGRRLRAGQGVLLLYRSANRDEREFEAPDRFDIRRRPRRILSFGHGAHVCLGQHVARLEARVMLEELLRSVPDYAVVEEEVVPARSEFVAGYLAVPIAFEPRAATRPAGSTPDPTR